MQSTLADGETQWRTSFRKRAPTKSFTGFTAVDCVDLHVERGHIHAPIGPNGAGKTTCFNLLTRFLVPSSGRVLFNGRDIIVVVVVVVVVVAVVVIVGMGPILGAIVAGLALTALGWLDLSDNPTLYDVVLVICAAGFALIVRTVHSPFGQVPGAFKKTKRAPSRWATMSAGSN